MNDAEIEAWFAKHFHNLGPKLETEVYNLLHAAKEDLKRLLGITPAPSAGAAPTEE